LPTENGLQYCGRVGLSGEHSRNTILLEALKISAPKNIFSNVGELPAGSYPAKPKMQALIEFAEWTPDLKLRQPILKAVLPVDETIKE